MTDWSISESDDGESGPVAGQRLAKARLAAGISLRDIAKELHLDEPKVQALEDNRFDDLGAAVFAKGHLRKYAELVGVSEEDVMTEYYQMTRATGPPPVVGPKRHTPREISFGPWIAGIVVLALVSAAAYWYMTPEPAATEETPTAPVAAGTADPDAAGNVSISLPVTGRELADSGPSADATADPAPENPPPEPPAAGETTNSGANPAVAASVGEAVDSPPLDPSVPTVELALSFSGDCWTEVTDANGRRLFLDLGSDGRVVTISGAAPLRVLLGDRNNVTLRVDGDDFAIPASGRRGNTARLTINAR